MQSLSKQIFLLGNLENVSNSFDSILWSTFDFQVTDMLSEVSKNSAVCCHIKSFVYNPASVDDVVGRSNASGMTCCKFEPSRKVFSEQSLE